MSSIAFVARGPSVDSLVYEGVISGGSVSWTQKMTYESFNSDMAAPVRIAAHDASNALLSYDADATGNKRYMFRFDGSATSSDLGTLGEIPRWEDFDFHTSGLAVALRPKYGATAMTLKVSTDYGANWTDADIDYLVTLLGANYTSLALGRQAFSIQVDESTGTFYLLIAYNDGADKWGLLKSTNGTAWTLVKEWTGADYKYDTCSLAVSNGYLYAVFYSADAQIVYVQHSSDSGTTWVETEVDSSVYYYPQIAAHDGTAILYLHDGGTSSRVFRSTNSGATWTQVLQIDYPDGTAAMEYSSVRASGSVFAVTFCYARSPNATGSWTDSTVHALAGDGDAYLCLWLSTDDGANWTLQLSPVVATSYQQQSLDVFVAAASESASASPSVSPSQPIMPINPYVMLTWSDDGGMTWSNEYWRPVGRIGEHRKRLIWRQLGRAKDRVFKIAVSDPCKWIFIDSIIDADEGTSRR